MFVFGALSLVCLGTFWGPSRLRNGWGGVLYGGAVGSEVGVQAARFGSTFGELLSVAADEIVSTCRSSSERLCPVASSAAGPIPPRPMCVCERERCADANP